MKKALIEELAGTWEVMAETEDGSNPARRATLRECADALRMIVTIPDEREHEMEELLRSACAIADRRGEQTAWERFGNSVRRLGLNGVTARTYYDMNAAIATESAPAAPRPCTDPAACNAHGCADPRGRCEEAAPAAGAASIDTPEFTALVAQWALLWKNSSDKSKQWWANIIAHINAWGAQQRDAGQQESIAKHHATVDDLNANYVAMERRKDEWQERAEKAEAALAQRAAGELPPLMQGAAGPQDWPEDYGQENGRYENRCIKCDCTFMGNKHRRVCKQCAARAVGGVDVATARRNMFSAYSKCFANSEMSPNQIADTLLAAAPAAPVGDRDERAAFEAWYAKRHPTPINSNLTWAHACKMDSWEVWQARAALTQQKGN